MMKFHGAHRKISEMLQQKALGKVTYMRAQLACWYPPIKGAWRQDPATGGGGALMDMATHLFDLLEYFNGPVRRVCAGTGRLVHRYKSEDSSVTLLEFANGALSTVDCFFNVPDAASRTRLEIYGQRGSILAEGTIGQGSGGTLEALIEKSAGGYDAAQNKDAQAGFQRVPFEAVNPYTAECAYFADCILNGRRPDLNDGANAIHILGIAEKAYRSACTGRWYGVA
jgi:predicted dehydrogenase